MKNINQNAMNHLDIAISAQQNIKVQNLNWLFSRVVNCSPGFFPIPRKIVGAISVKNLESYRTPNHVLAHLKRF